MILTDIARKEMIHLVRDKRTLMIVTFIPVLLLLLFGFAISTEVNNVNVATVVTNHTDDMRLAVERLRNNPYITYLGMTTDSDIDRLLRTGQADAVAILRDAGGDMKVQIVADAANTTLAQSAQAYISATIAGNTVSSPVVTRTLYNPQLKSSYNFVPGILGMIFILICAMMTSVSIVSEQESGTMNLLLVSPVRPSTVIIGKLIPYFGLSCIILALMLLTSYTLLDIPFSSGVVNVVILSVVYIIMALSIGLLVSTLVWTQFAALVVSALLFMVPVVMLSGMIFPVDNMPRVLQWISCVVPARWYIAAMRKLMIQELPMHYVASELVILLSITVVILAVAIRKFRTR